MGISPIIFAAVSVLFAVIDINGNSLKRQNTDLVYIGTYKRNFNKSDFDESNYYVSVNPTVWATARDDCKKLVGDLLALDSSDESLFITEMLNKYGFGLLFWTAGMFDSGQQLWRWVTSGGLLPEKNSSWSPWGSAYPPNYPNALHRVVIVHLNEFDSHWETRPNSQMQRYICEEAVKSCH